MPRNDQAVRLLVVLKQLEASRHGLTLEQLSDSLAPGSTRHLRTIRRDLAALEEGGYPLVAERINGHTCWRLMEGFRNVPGLRFSPSELMALTFSRRLITPLEGTELHTSLQSALGKAAAALPPQGVALVQQLDGTFSLGLDRTSVIDNIATPSIDSPELSPTRPPFNCAMTPRRAAGSPGAKSIPIVCGMPPAASILSATVT